MQMNRRDAIKTISLGSAVLMTAPLVSLSGDLVETVSSGTRYPFTLPDLPYAYDALAEFIDPETMNIHHTKHHAGYVKNLNAALETAAPELQAMTIEELLAPRASPLPEPLHTAIVNHGGGHANHTLFWKVLSPTAGGKPEGLLANKINQQFGSHEACVEQLQKSAMSIFGSGWAWLTIGSDGLVIETTPNQNSPLLVGRMPLLGIDVWEHAYYLKYQNRRVDYVKAVLDHINWQAVGEVFPG